MFWKRSEIRRKTWAFQITNLREGNNDFGGLDLLGGSAFGWSWHFGSWVCLVWAQKWDKQTRFPGGVSELKGLGFVLWKSGFLEQDAQRSSRR